MTDSTLYESLNLSTTFQLNLFNHNQLSPTTTNHQPPTIKMYASKIVMAFFAVGAVLAAPVEKREAEALPQIVPPPVMYGPIGASKVSSVSSATATTSVEATSTVVVSTVAASSTLSTVVVSSTPSASSTTVVASSTASSTATVVAAANNKMATAVSSSSTSSATPSATSIKINKTAKPKAGSA
ncbi:hypothetical protein SLS56_011511 [Neofusicoccum ribis]|uniref:Uncharacterized protein n=1 Tax=Neofusicoccum ribis TaxID=45134 RepID=A0ABR3SC33_9PEZI